MMFVIGIGVMVLQALCAVHAFQSDRQNWIFFIVIGGPLGVCAYFAFVIMPQIYGPRAVKAQIKTIANPAARLKKAEAALAEVETAANHNDLADAMFDMRAFAGAADHYRKALDCLRGPDPLIEKKLAEALFENGQAAEALKLVENQSVPPSVGEADRLTLLRARIIEHLGRRDEAIDLYRDIATRLPGAEARCRLAALLLQKGSRDEAQSALEEVSRTLDKTGAAKSGEEAEMHQWALKKLAELRAT